MKQSLSKIIIVLFVFAFNQSKSYSQDVTDSNTKILCTGADIELPDIAPATYQVLRNTTNSIIGATAVSLTGARTISSPTTGYYFVMQKASGANSCWSDAAVLPIYVLPSLAVSIDANDYCVENTSSTTFTGTATPSSAINNASITIVYQWYKDVSNTPEAISGANSFTHTPTENVAGVTTKYTLKAGFLIGTNKYCPSEASKDVTVEALPTAPTISISGSTPFTW